MLKQKVLAEYLGISKYALNRIENANLKIFPKKTAYIIAKYFGKEYLNDFLDLIPFISALIERPPISKFYSDLVRNSKYTPFMKKLAKIYRMGPGVFNEYLKYSDDFFDKYITDENEE